PRRGARNCANNNDEAVRRHSTPAGHPEPRKGRGELRDQPRRDRQTATRTERRPHGICAASHYGNKKAQHMMCWAFLQ
ncbi:MAG: hypothetical protein FWE15_27595, partial [Actinomycetia bacterium]|nr:hypothetical protein [Actinomycetes bacterium]